MPKEFSYKSLSFFIVLAVILLLIFFNFRGWLGVPKNIVFQVTSPFLKTFQWIGNKVFSGLEVYFTLKNLSRENANLTQENRRLWQENSILEEVVRENELLRQRLELEKIVSRKFVLANIIGDNIQPGQYLLIDKGENDGLKSEMAVVTANDFLIGKIIEVEKSYAKVLLITDANSLVNALTQETRAGGIVKGVHGLGLNMEMIPIGKEIKIGETVLSSGRNSPIPQDLIIGKVSEVFSKENEIFQKAVVQPAADFDNLESVFVIIK